MPRRGTLGLIVAVVAALGLSTPAAAVTPSAENPNGSYCAQNAIEAGSSDVSTMHCFNTFTESMSFATNGKVQLTPAQAAAPLTQDELAPSQAGANARVVLSVDYLDPDWRGSSITYYAPATCNKRHWYVNSIQKPWNNAISSIYMSGGCEGSIWDLPNEQDNGHYRWMSGDGSDGMTLGAMDNKASSQCFTYYMGC